MTAADLIHHSRSTAEARGIIVEAYSSGLITADNRDAIQYDSSGNYRVHRTFDAMRSVARSVQIGGNE